MKGFLVLAIICLAGKAFANNHRRGRRVKISRNDCIKKISSFVELKSGEKFEFEGKKNGLACSGAISLGLGRDTELGDIRFNIQQKYIMEGLSSEGTNFVDGTLFSKADKVVDQKIKKCEIKGDTLSIKISSKYNSGWNNKYTHEVQIKKTGNSVSSFMLKEKKHRTLFTGGHKMKGSCEF